MTREMARKIVTVFELLRKELGDEILTHITNLKLRHYDYLKEYANGKTILYGDPRSNELVECENPAFDSSEQCYISDDNCFLLKMKLMQELNKSADSVSPDSKNLHNPENFYCLNEKFELYVVPYTYYTASSDNLLNKYVTSDNNITCNKITTLCLGGVYLDFGTTFVEYNTLYNNYKFVNTDIPCGVHAHRLGSDFGSLCPYKRKTCDIIIGSEHCCKCRDNAYSLAEHYIYCAHK